MNPPSHTGLSVCDFDMCILVLVWGGVSETSFLLSLYLFFAGVLCTCVMVVLHMYSTVMC